jgi:hypothetical protein
LKKRSNRSNIYFFYFGGIEKHCGQRRSLVAEFPGHVEAVDAAQRGEQVDRRGHEHVRLHARVQQANPGRRPGNLPKHKKTVVSYVLILNLFSQKGDFLQIKSLLFMKEIGTSVFKESADFCLIFPPKWLKNDTNSHYNIDPW